MKINSTKQNREGDNQNLNEFNTKNLKHKSKNRSVLV